MKKTIIILSLLFAVFTIQAQSLFGPVQNRVRNSINSTPVKVDNLKSSLSITSDSTANLLSLTASVNALAYQFGANDQGRILNGFGIGVSRVNFKMIDKKAVPIWDISLMAMTSVKYNSDPGFTGAGGLLSIGFNPGYLVGIGGNTIIREGIAYIGTQSFNNGHWYLCTSVGINL